MTGWKSEFSISSTKPLGGIQLAKPATVTSSRGWGSVAIKIKWYAKESRLWLNGKECKYMSDMDWYRRWCAEIPLFLSR